MPLIRWYPPFYPQREPSQNTLEKDTFGHCTPGPYDFKEWRLCMEPWQQLVMFIQLLWQCLIAAVWCWFLRPWKLFHIRFCDPEPVAGNSEGIVRLGFLQTQFRKVFWFTRFTFWRSCLSPKWFQDTYSYQINWFEPVWSIVIYQHLPIEILKTVFRLLTVV